MKSVVGTSPRGHLNERGKTFAAKSVASMLAS
jgi:hypothetical protein